MRRNDFGNAAHGRNRHAQHNEIGVFDDFRHIAAGFVDNFFLQRDGAMLGIAVACDDFLSQPALTQRQRQRGADEANTDDGDFIERRARRYFFRCFFARSRFWLGRGWLLYRF